jgi:mRNA interferase MazF
MPLLSLTIYLRIAEWLGRMNPDNQNRLMKVSAADTFQIRSVSKKRFSRKIGAVSSTILDEIKTAVKAVIDTD